MPVQINEIIIRANIMEQPEKIQAPGTGTDNNLIKDEIIKECTEQVLEILKAKTER
jgi:hypothetical protein